MKKTVYTDETYQEFVSIWQKAKTLDAVSRRLNIKPRRASTIAAFLRNHGVALKCFPRGRVVDYTVLRALAATPAK